RRERPHRNGGRLWLLPDDRALPRLVRADSEGRGDVRCLPPAVRRSRHDGRVRVEGYPGSIAWAGAGLGARVHERTRTGVERLRDDPSLAGGHRAGLVTNHAGVLPDLTSNVTALMAAGIRLTALFAPEHGLWGTAQA